MQGSSRWGAIPAGPSGERPREPIYNLGGRTETSVFRVEPTNLSGSSSPLSFRSAPAGEKPCATETLFTCVPDYAETMVRSDSSALRDRIRRRVSTAYKVGNSQTRQPAQLRRKGATGRR